MDNGVFVFRFSCEEDKNRVLESGPWNIGQRPLFLRAWNPKLQMEKMSMRSIPLWVYLPGLPFQYWSTKNLSVIGSVIGRPLYIDRLTKTRERLSYARISVEVDAKEPLMDTVTISNVDEEKHIQKIIYN